MKVELLAPSGNFSKLKTALYFGADAVYVGGKNFSLRSYADNFTVDELRVAVEYVKQLNKKIYVTANILPKNSDFTGIFEYFSELEKMRIDGIIISDLGVLNAAKRYAPSIDIHISTQANTLNKYAAQFLVDSGAKRIILARELRLDEIREIRDYLPDNIELEAFVHGAMCISYSGRCLLSDYFNGRSSNRGECIQSCRWKYQIRESSKSGEFYDIEEDEKGTYILNSKDLNMINYLDLLIESGVCSLKIEGRMKSEYYLATVINAYRKAIDAYLEFGSKYKEDPFFMNEVMNTNHRAFTTAYALGNNSKTVNYTDSQSIGERAFVATVLDYDKANLRAKIEMRNRFLVGDTLEVLSPNEYHNSKILVERLTDLDGNAITDAKNVQQLLYLSTNVNLCRGDILRRE